MAEGLTDQQKELVDAAAMGALVELMRDPTVAKLPSGVIATVFLAGIKAGVDAYDAVTTDELATLKGTVDAIADTFQ